MLIVKIMSGENLPDDDSRKSHKLIVGATGIEFFRDPAPLARISIGLDTPPFDIPLDGNVYVMNESGKTISSFGSGAPPAAG